MVDIPVYNLLSLECSTVQYSMVWGGTVWHGTRIHLSVVQYSKVRGGTVWHGTGIFTF
jgi:hypothetical protein